MASPTNNGAEDPGEDSIGIPQTDDDLDAEMAASMVAEGVVGSEDEDDLEAQMAAAMAMESGGSDDDLEAQMASALSDDSGMMDHAGLLDALSDDDDAGIPVQPVNFPQLRPSDERVSRDDIDRLLDVTLVVSVELGRKQMQIKDILELGPGKIVELEKLAGEPVDLLVNGKLLARGEVVVVDENFGVRITDLIDPKDRIKML